MTNLRGKADSNDIEYISRLHGEPLFTLPAPISKNGKINPHVTRFFYKGLIRDIFHVQPVYYEHLSGTWRPLSEVCDSYSNKKAVLKSDWDKRMTPRFLIWWMKRMELLNGSILIPTPSSLLPLSFANIHFVSSTYFPDPDPETTTCDGFVGRGSVNESWATIRSSAGNTVNDSGTDASAPYVLSTSTSNQWGNLRRNIYGFDTSNVTSGFSVTAGTFSPHASGIDNTIAVNYCAVQAASASNTALATGDYANNTGLSLVSDSILAGSGLSAGYIDFTLNTSGLSYVNKTGVTKMGCQFNEDRTNSSPTWASAVDSGFSNGDFAEMAGTASDPKLTLTYVVAANSSGILASMGF